MSQKLQAPRGTLDVLPAESGKWQAIEQIAREVARDFNYAEIRTPIFESTDLFHRGVGETTDIVKKETYTFTDRGERSLTLRPEGTAGVVRAAIEHGFLDQQGARLKVYYIGANFRYEKPQKGRYHIHHQFGVEAFGVADPMQDAECILLQMEFYRRAGLRDTSLRVNSLGDATSKQRYRDMLRDFLKPNASKLSEDSQRRLEENPLRILDSKDPCDVEACKGAPPSLDALSAESRAHFDEVCKLLESSSIPFKIDSNLVRGFDYYTGTLWEVTAAGLGSQSAVGGGGRYDNLVEQLGGKPTPGVGFGSGLERLLLALDEQKTPVDPIKSNLIWIAYQNDNAKLEAFKLATELRARNFSVDLELTGRKMKNQFAMADKDRAKICLILGEDEIKNGTVGFKDFVKQEQTTASRAELVEKLKSGIGM